MTPEQAKKLTEAFSGFKLKGGSPVVPNDKESVDEFLFRVQRFGEFSAGNKATNIKVEVDKGTYFETASPASGTINMGQAAALVAGAHEVWKQQQGGQGVQQNWLTTKEAAYTEAARSLGNEGTGRSFSDPDNLSVNEKKLLDDQFNIYAQAGRWTYASRAPTATGPYKADIVGSGETRTLILSQDGKRVASSHLGAALTDYTEDELNVVRQEITGSDERFVLVQARGKTIAQWREGTLDESKIGHANFKAAWEQAGEEGIPVERRDVKTSIAPDGSTRYFPAIKPAGAPEADIGTTEKAETTFINLGEGQGELLLYKTGNQVGSVRIPPKPGKTIQNTFSTPGGGVRAVFSDGSEEVYGEEDFTLGTPTRRMGPNGQVDWYIETAPGRYSQIPETFKPTVVRIGNREFTQDVSGRLTPLAREFDPGITQIGGRTIMQQPSGQISELQRQFEPGVITRDGLQLLQQPSGAVSQTRAANMNEIIAQALVDGHWDKALAYQDFANRPSAKEAFDAALSFARSPADQQLVSSIARGETPVVPPPPGVVQRIGPQPDFLVQAYNEFQQRLRGGRPPTPEEQSQYAARYRAGETPLSDELRLKMKTQEDANQRQIEKLELQRETNQRNFDLKMQQQEQDFSLRLAQATGSFSPVGEQRFATEEARRMATQDDADKQKRDDPTGYINDLVAKEIGMAPKELTPMEKIAAGLQKREEEYTKLWSELNKELSAGVGGRGKYAGIVSSDEIQQWMRTATQNAGSNPSIRNELIFEALSGLAEGKYASSGKLARDDAEATAGPTQIGGVGDVVHTDYVADLRAAQLAEQKAGWASPTSPDLFDDDSDDDGGETGELAETEAADVAEASGDGGHMGDPGDDFGDFGGSGDLGESYDDDWDFDTDFDLFAKGGMTRGKNLEIVGEEGPELVDLPPGTFVLPLKNLNQRQLRQAQKKGIPGYQSGGIVFDGINYRTQNLPLGLRQQQAGRAITPPRGYLSQAAGLTLPSAQAFQNITPESREVFFDVAKQAGIPQGAFAQELRTAFPGGQRLPVSRNYPLRFRGVR